MALEGNDWIVEENNKCIIFAKNSEDEKSKSYKMVKYNSSIFVDLKRFVILQMGLTSLWCDREGKNLIK